jgi:uncharacterized membrane protein
VSKHALSGGELMITQETLLVQLFHLIEQVPAPVLCTVVFINFCTSVNRRPAKEAPDDE